MGTSQAIDVINGGGKGTTSPNNNFIVAISRPPPLTWTLLTVVNALPESVFALVNHRIAMESSVKQVQDHLTTLLTPFAKSLSANLISFKNTIYTPSAESNPRNTTITLSNSDDTLDPAPVSPEEGYAWEVLSNTVKSVFGEETILAPSLMTGNTDTKFYWDLSRDIWRFTPISAGGRANAHTVDEWVGIEDHVRGMGFYVKLIRFSE